jgi:hypothetical protein
VSERRRRRIEIPSDVAGAVDLPADLDSTQRAPYAIPSTRRRRNAAVVYTLSAALAAAVAFTHPGMVFAAVLLGLVAGWHLASAWEIRVLDPQALEAANREVPMAVGHASAAVGFDGWRARPIWNVLVFSADDPPTERGLVRVDAVDGTVVGTYVESIVDSQGQGQRPTANGPEPIVNSQ